MSYRLDKHKSCFSKNNKILTLGTTSFNSFIKPFQWTNVNTSQLQQAFQKSSMQDPVGLSNEYAAVKKRRRQALTNKKNLQHQYEIDNPLQKRQKKDNILSGDLPF